MTRHRDETGADLAETERILVAGDWHGNREWALKVIWQVKQLLADEQHPIILHLGDFGIWPGAEGERYLREVSWALEQADAELWFVDGNHEDFTRLREVAATNTEYGRFRYPVTDSVWWLPRGCRWTWHGRSWLALGGGVSLDRVIRTEGRDWWPQEEITDEQEAAVLAGGHADVMACHDRPSGVVHSFPDRPSWWDQRDVDRSERHEERMQRIVDAVQPSHFLHGHLHRAYSRVCDFGYGPVAVTGLNRDDEPGNYAMLNIQSMTWESS